MYQNEELEKVSPGSDFDKYCYHPTNTGISMAIQMLFS